MRTVGHGIRGVRTVNAGSVQVRLVPVLDALHPVLVGPVGEHVLVLVHLPPLAPVQRRAGAEGQPVEDGAGDPVHRQGLHAQLGQGRHVGQGGALGLGVSRGVVHRRVVAVHRRPGSSIGERRVAHVAPAEVALAQRSHRGVEGGQVGHRGVGEVVAVGQQLRGVGLAGGGVGEDDGQGLARGEAVHAKETGAVGPHVPQESGPGRLAVVALACKVQKQGEHGSREQRTIRIPPAQTAPPGAQILDARAPQLRGHAPRLTPSTGAVVPAVVAFRVMVMLVCPLTDPTARANSRTADTMGAWPGGAEWRVSVRSGGSGPHHSVPRAQVGGSRA